MAGELNDRIIADEGGYVNDPADAGGPTKYGITLATLSAFRGRPCTAADVAALTRDDAIAIYDAKYVTGPGFDKITDAMLRTAAADAAVLFGPDRVIGALQSLCGVTADGIFGPVTVAAVNKREARELVNRLSLWRIRKHITRVVTDESQIRFLRGWFERAASFVT
jgi:lysozyme family protein